MISCYYQIFFFFSFVGLNITFKIRRFQYLMSQHTVIKSNMKMNLQRVGVKKGVASEEEAHLALFIGLI